MKRKRFSMSILFLLFILAACSNHNNDENAMENNSEDNSDIKQIVQSSMPEYTLDRAVEEADLIANITVTEIVDIIEWEYDEHTIHEYTKYKASINHYYFDNLDYGQEIIFYQAGGQNFQFENDPLLEESETYIVFLDERDSQFGEALTFTGGPQGRYKKVGDTFVRQLTPRIDKDVEKVSEIELIDTLSEKVDLDLNMFE